MTPPYTPETTPGSRANSRLVWGESDSFYHSQRDISSSSMLKKALISAQHYLLSAISINDSDSSAMRVGRLVHCLALEEGKFSSKYSLYQGTDSSRTTAFKDWAQKQGGRDIVNSDEYELAKRIVDRLRSTTIQGEPFSDFLLASKPEASLYFTDPTTGIACRTRHDVWHPSKGMIDLKTTRHTNVRDFLRQAIDLDYDLQAFMYSYADALFFGLDELRPFTFLVVNTDAPHSTFVLRAGSTFLDNGRKKYVKAMTTLAASIQTSVWPDVSCEEVLEIEPWQQFAAAK
jgi:PDDEXK-like domain of unknown function (DUF3799)